MNKLVKYTFGGSSQDTIKSKHPLQYYFDAQHIRIIATDSQSTGGIANEKGTELVISIPSITIYNKAHAKAGTIEYGTKSLLFIVGGEIDYQLDNSLLPGTSTTQTIIGHTTTRDNIILFTTDGLGMDCIWSVNSILDESYDLELLYVRNLEFSVNTPIQALFNYENENIQKIYWVDGQHQISFLNTKHSNIEGNSALIDVPSNSLRMVGNVNFSQPTITSTIAGGTHTAGMIQYAYNLYRLNASQTKISPLSTLIPLGKGINLGGGELNEQVSATPVVNINNIDTAYTHIRVYAIKYTSYNEIPSISLIEERELDKQTNIIVYDDGSIISTLSLEEFLFLGSDPIVPKHIETKDNRLFLSNIQTENFILPEELDCRAYSFPISSTTTQVFDSITSQLVANPVGGTTINSSFNLALKHDAINLKYDINKYLFNSTNFGGEGKYIKFKINKKSLTNPENYRVLKDREIYRFGIEFYNNLGQTSVPQWIIDYKMPSGNLINSFNTVEVTLKSEFYTWLNNYQFEKESDKPVGYRILRVDRTIADKTIVCQGILGGMMVNSIRDSYNAPLFTLSKKRDQSDIDVKIPNFLLRTFTPVTPLKENKHLEAMQFLGPVYDPNENRLNEIQYDSSKRKADTYQYTSMYQMYSPEILFGSVPLNSSLKFNIIGGAVNNINHWWGQERNIVTKVVMSEGKTLYKIAAAAPGGENIEINGGITLLNERGLICDSNGSDPGITVGFNQYYREFNTFIPAPSILSYNIYGSPELTVRGQGDSMYNNNSKYKYKNTLEGFITDGEDNYDETDDLDRAIISINSHGEKCITLVADRGDNSDTVLSYNRTTLEQLYTAANINNTSTVLISELIKNESEIYLSGIYGGNSYEDKKRNNYIGIGSYNYINTSVVQIDSPGDTYVQYFSFMRIGKTDTEVYSGGTNQITEVIKVKLETTIDLKNRNDLSFNGWDSIFQPRSSAYHNYNTVYSQQSNLVKSSTIDINFKRIENFDTRITTTKLKIPNESIDSWSDILQNEVLDLNGKYGPINSLISFKDNLYTLQDEAISAISINPRVQVQGSDGIGLELGTGGILYDYNYLTTTSGSLNKWGVTSAKKGIYYYDALNKGIGRIPDKIDINLTDFKGFHSYFNNNYDYNLLKVDNPLLNKGVVFGKDNYNNDIYFTLLQGNKSFTRCFNELRDEFIDLKTYTPSMYINKGDKLISIPNTNKATAYEHNKGEYNKFYGVSKPSFIILQVNPESDISCVFDSIFYNSELYLNDIDQPTKTLTGIQAYNEYQDSGMIPLIVGRDKNLRRKFREWKAEIPRQGRNRIRNPWIFLKLQLDNTSNYKMILHDITISYTV